LTASDKRTTPRFEVGNGVYVVYVEGSGAVRDLSLNGAFILDPQPLPVGEHLRLDLRMGHVSVLTDAVVRRCVPGQGMGVEFLNVNPEGKRRLRIYIADLATASAKSPSKSR